jgi:uncharacterized membrane protein YdbT with pleckstrin-like domain
MSLRNTVLQLLRRYSLWCQYHIIIIIIIIAKSVLFSPLYLWIKFIMPVLDVSLGTTTKTKATENISRSQLSLF